MEPILVLRSNSSLRKFWIVRNYPNYYSLVGIGINRKNKKMGSNTHVTNSTATSLVILGTIQDAGQPHIGCDKECCSNLFDNPDKNKQVISLGLYDASTGKKYLFDATPDLPRQMKSLKEYAISSENKVMDGIFLTHAHIGHYTGLMYLGKEAINAQNILVYAMSPATTIIYPQRQLDFPII